MTITLGTAPDSWGVWFAADPHQVSWQTYLDELGAAGYQHSELGPYGYMPTDASVLSTELAERQLTITGGAVGVDLANPAAVHAQRSEITATCALLKAVGADYLLVIDEMFTDLRTGAIVRPPHLENSGWTQLARSASALREIAGDNGLSLLLHPHADTHVATEEDIRRFIDETHGGIDLCLDVGHHAYCGGEPLSFFTEHVARVKCLHLKCIDPQALSRAQEQQLAFAQAVESEVFVDPQYGSPNIAALLERARSLGWSGYAIVEQDMYPADPGAPLPIAIRTRDYLRNAGFG